MLMRAVRRALRCVRPHHSLLRFIGVGERMESPDWWTYFGSFGDDIIDDEGGDDT